MFVITNKKTYHHYKPKQWWIEGDYYTHWETDRWINFAVRQYIDRPDVVISDRDRDIILDHIGGYSIGT